MLGYTTLLFHVVLLMTCSPWTPFVESFLVPFSPTYFKQPQHQRQHPWQQPPYASSSSFSSSCLYSTSPFWYDSSPSSRLVGNNSTGFHTSLAIVPPLPEWDRLQRARHYARDPLFHTWPPAIRLFHPFGSNSGASALEVAQVVEELELEAFTITLDTWVIVPHLEAIEAAYTASNKAVQLWDTPSLQEQEEYNEQEAIRTLIEKEERIGQEKAKARAERGARKRQRQEQQLEDNDENDDDENEVVHDTNQEDFLGDLDPTNTNNSKDPRSMYQEQQRNLLDFGGPCILCLEPDAESKALLQDIREELAMLLHGRGHNYFSASSCFSPHYIQEAIFQPSEYRPLIPMASFESLPAAMEVARRLQGLWGEPLTFDVKELHIISSRDDHEAGDDAAWGTSGGGRGGAAAATAGQAPIFDTDNPEAMYYSNINKNDEAWGCNARIMLVGEEFELLENNDDDFNEEDLAAKMAQVCEQGEIGGNDISNDYTILDDEEDMSDIETWLNNDEDYDEGIKVTIGRTQFLTGDQRFYKGMPASSVVDGKDRSMGDVGAVSGLARRRRTVTRAGAVSWDEGEYGRRQTDYLPWSKREKPKRVERLLDLPASGFTNLANMDSQVDDDIDDEVF